MWATIFIMRLGKVAIVAQNLKSFLWKVIFSQEAINIASDIATMFSPIIVYMVNGKEFWMAVTTTSTFITICFKNIATKFITGPFCKKKVTIGMLVSMLSVSYSASIAGISGCTRIYSTLDAHSCKTILFTDIAHMDASSFSLFFNLFRIVQYSLVSLLIHVWIAFKCSFVLFVPAIFTGSTKSILSTGVFPKVFKCKVLFACRAALFRGCLNYMRIFMCGMFVWLCAQCFKIKCALRQILRYTVLHSLGELLAITPPVVSATRGQNHVQLPRHYNMSQTSLQLKCFNERR